MRVEYESVKEILMEGKFFVSGWYIEEVENEFHKSVGKTISTVRDFRDSGIELASGNCSSPGFWYYYWRWEEEDDMS